MAAIDMPTAAELAAYQDFATALAREAGTIARDFFAGSRVAERKADRSLLTEADTRINQMVIDRIQAKFPGHDVLGEEASALTGADYVWVCDPIDGTGPYVLGLPYSCFEIALVISGTPVVSVIYDFTSDLLFAAVKGSGATCNGKVIHVSSGPTMAHAIVVQSSKTSDFVDAARLRMQTELVCYRLFMLQATSRECALVADGKADGGIFIGNTVHDVAPAKLLIEEAGGRCTDLFGNDQRYDQPVKGFVFSNGILHDQLLDIVQKSLIQ